MTQRKAHYFEIHVFGGETEGEGIILRLPDGSFGSVDSCIGRTKGGKIYLPMLDFLKSNSVSRLAFSCLTHPHADHFRGLARLIFEFDVKEFWLPNKFCAEDLKRIVKLKKIPAHEVNAFGEVEDADELQEIFAYLCKRIRRSKTPGAKSKFKVAQAEMNSKLYPPSAAAYRVVALAPHGNDVFEFNNQLSRAFDDSGKIKDDLPEQKFNRISMALLIVMPKFKVLLGGDVEKAGWRRTIIDSNEKDWKSVLYKVSHHGSAGAFCNELQDAVYLPDKLTTSVLTGYARSRLPTVSMISSLSDISKQVAVAHKRHVTPHGVQTSLSPSREAIAHHFSIPVEPISKSRKAILDTFGASAVPETSNTGRCSFYFNRDGLLVDQEFSSSAHLISGAESGDSEGTLGRSGSIL